VKIPRHALRWFSFLLSIAALLSLPRAAVAKERVFIGPRKLHHRIESVLRQSEAYRGFWGIELVRLPDGKLLYAQNSDHLFLPASNMKLFTTAAAMETLGADYVFRTTVESDTAPDAEGRVQDLYLVGRGDPNLSNRVLPYQPKAQGEAPADAAFQKLADQIVTRGVREVTGNLVADDSYFLYEPYSHGWAEEDLAWGYGAPVTALAYNDNALTLHLQAGATVGEAARVWLEPMADYYKLENRLTTVAAGAEKHIFVERAPGSMELDVWGQIPVSAGEEDRVAIFDPPQLIGDLFRRALESRGIALRGRVEVRHYNRFETLALGGGQDCIPQPPSRFVLAEYASPPLREDIKVTNKVSQNLHAEMLLRTVGRQLKNCGSLRTGLEALQEFAVQAGIAPDEIRFNDGSGLSRRTLIAPQALIKLLEFMARSPRFEPFFDSLPVAGVDGTLADRFRGTPAEGRIHAKTGTIEHVNSLSGYMDLPSGRRLAFSIMGNCDPLRSEEGAATLDRVALALYDWFAHRQ
jgi:D-alanyl-D-alanine carboxypeptidase/D-alanyl-D-alanine-endopeptidase (penicillin-binding protein 4)